MSKTITTTISDELFDKIELFCQERKVIKQDLIRLIIEKLLHNNHYLESEKMYWTQKYREKSKQLELDVTLPDVSDENKATVSFEINKQAAMDLLNYSKSNRIGLGVIFNKLLNDLLNDEA
jgi:hypothetical protein